MKKAGIISPKPKKLQFNATILQKENILLRKIAQPVDFAKIPKTRIATILKDMQKALYSQNDGVAIAAPQIGISLRIFVVSKKIFELTGNTTHIPANDLIFINPTITKLSREKALMEEGCLSVRWLYGKVSRSKKATIEAYDISGKKFTRGASGVLAQVFQHETDHLNGVLFIDKAEHVEEILPEKTAS